jgi:hypothetical protein
VTIDNLDVTTGGRTGKGANDGDDVVNISLSVLSHANPSFYGASEVNSLTYDFGTFTQVTAEPLFSWDLFNLLETPGYTASLDLDAISVSGNADSFRTEIATFGGDSSLAAGNRRGYATRFDTSAVGAFSATYTLGFSDEDLPGAVSLGPLTLTLSGIVASPAVDSADFDSDGMVDGADFLAWQVGVGTSAAGPAQGDANGDMAVDGADLAIWQQKHGIPPAVATALVPEPATFFLFGLGLWSFQPRSRAKLKRPPTIKRASPLPAATPPRRERTRQCRSAQPIPSVVPQVTYNPGFDLRKD